VAVFNIPDLSSPDIMLFIYDPNDLLVVEQHMEDPGPYSFGFKVNVSGTYHMYIDGYGYSNTDAYSFRVNKTSP
jgi:hypothetical protein